MKAIKKAYNKVLKATAIAIAAPGYAVTKTVKAVTYGLTENETARGLADLYEAGGEILMYGALMVGEF
jgi:hypothetical protein